ncbi:hypothetical protein BJ742DRAFT_784607 [Cladochytrium replicatum]|nr:hypothetical protein BJ742DRAFT_784607 [Cladochytrium replicatum]
MKHQLFILLVSLWCLVAVALARDVHFQHGGLAAVEMAVAHTESTDEHDPLCENVTCGPIQECVEGKCIRDRCAVVRCGSPFTRCIKGKCTIPPEDERESQGL